MPEASLPFQFNAKVIHGDGYGHVLGYPTANADVSGCGLAERGLSDGVYAGFVRLEDGRRYKAGMVIGSSTIQGVAKFEAHLAGFDGDLYGQQLSFEIVRSLRPYRVFESVDDLIAQIGKDMEEVERVLRPEGGM